MSGGSAAKSVSVSLTERSYKPSLGWEKERSFVDPGVVLGVVVVLVIALLVVYQIRVFVGNWISGIIYMFIGRGR